MSQSRDEEQKTEEISVEVKYMYVNVLGKIIPSKELVGMILQSWRDAQNICNFLELSNKFIQDTHATFNPELYLPAADTTESKMTLRLYLELYKNYQRQCEIANLNFVFLWQSISVSRWFVFALGNSRGVDADRLYREFSMLQQYRLGKCSRDSFKIKGTKDRSDLEKYPEFREAQIHLNCFDIVTNLISETNAEMQELKLSYLDINKRLSKRAETSKINYHLFTCPFCNEVKSLLGSGKDLKSCGSDECEKAYDRKAKQDKNPKKGWVEDLMLEKPCNCLGGCGSNRKKLNSERICKGCYSGSAS